MSYTNRKKSMAELILSASIFKSTIETCLYAAGASQVTLEGISARMDQGKISDSTMTPLYGSPVGHHCVTVKARWRGLKVDEGMVRAVNMAIDYPVFDSRMLNYDLSTIKAWARDVAKNIIHDRIDECMTRAKFELSLSTF